MKKIVNILLIVSLFALAYCEKEDTVIDLKLDNNTVELKKNGTAIVIIEDGNGEYKVESDNKEVADANLFGTTITIKAFSEGDAKITVTDAKGKTAIITVKVDYTIPTAPKFVWNGMQVIFDKADGYGITILASGIALTDLVKDKKQYFLSWDGGLTAGDKTNSKLVIVQSGKEAEEVKLTSLKVIQAGISGNYIIFNDGSKNGELYFIE